MTSTSSDEVESKYIPLNTHLLGFKKSLKFTEKNIRNAYLLLCFFFIAADKPEDLNQEYVSQKLQNGASHIWQDIQTKIKTFLLAFDFTGFKVDEFMQILSVIHK